MCKRLPPPIWRLAQPGCVSPPPHLPNPPVGKQDPLHNRISYGVEHRAPICAADEELILPEERAEWPLGKGEWGVEAPHFLSYPTKASGTFSDGASPPAALGLPGPPLSYLDVQVMLAGPDDVQVGVVNGAFVQAG